MKRLHIDAKDDLVLRLAHRDQPVAAIIELVWNSLDAEAHFVLVTWNHAAGRSGLDRNGRVIDLEPATPESGHTGGFHLPSSSSLLLEG
jgi:hypothetical protein